MQTKILVVDDDPDIVEALKMTLEANHYQVFTAANGTEGLKQVKAVKPNLIILDVMMETETEGFHVVYKIREDPRLKDIPIIILTCIEEKTGEVLEPEKSGDFLPVQAFLRKPLDPSVLRQKVAELI